MLNLYEINYFNITGRYVKGIEVEWKDDKGASTGYINEDINKGMGGKHVYITAKWSDNKDEAANSFEFLKTPDKIDEYKDLAKGAGGDYRYLVPKLSSATQKITGIFLTEIRQQNCTADINGGRGGRDLFLCWTKAEGDQI